MTGGKLVSCAKVAASLEMTTDELVALCHEKGLAVRGHPFTDEPYISEDAAGLLLRGDTKVTVAPPSPGIPDPLRAGGL